MTQQEIQLVAALAGLALAITLGDLILSLIRHRLRVSRARRLQTEKGDPMVDDSAAAGEAMVRRLLAMEAASEQFSSHSERGIGRG